jgi:hypothetical protein
MVFKFVNQTARQANGRTAIYMVNDTTYFTFTDTLPAPLNSRERQYFIMPYDQYSNTGDASQVAVINHDNFYKAYFIKPAVVFEPKNSGVRLRWHFSDIPTARKIEIYRSEGEKGGFSFLAEAQPTDTTYLDQKIWPEKKYNYYFLAIAKVGKRSTQSDNLSISVPGISLPQVMATPDLLKVTKSKNGNLLLVRINDSTTTALRYYRLGKTGATPMPNLVPVNRSKYIAFADTMPFQEEQSGIAYMVRNEKGNKAFSSPSEKAIVQTADNQDETSIMQAFAEKDKVIVYWEDLKMRNSNISGYALFRHMGDKLSKSPLSEISHDQKNNCFEDKNVLSGNTYTYQLQLLNADGSARTMVAEVTVEGK